MPSTLADSLERVWSAPVPIDLFHAAAVAVAKLPEEDRKTLDGRALAVIHCSMISGSKTASDSLQG
jgi:hypothetical protein